jgi:hypothetical protein
VDAPQISIAKPQAPHISVQPAKKVAAARRKTPPWLPLAIGGGVLGLGTIIALAAAIIFYFQTPNGTLRVEINDPEIEVLVKGTDIVLKKAEKEDITLTPGEHTLTVKRGEFELLTTNFQLRKGETTTVKVDLLPGKVQVAMADGTILGERATETAVATTNGRTTTTTRPTVFPEGESALDFTGEGGLVEVPSLKLPLEGDLTIEAYVTARKTSFGSGLKDEQIRLVGQEGTAKLVIYDGLWNGYAWHDQLFKAVVRQWPAHRQFR